MGAGLAGRLSAASLQAGLPWLALALMIAAAYWPALFAGFVWDDKVFRDAPAMLTLGGLRDIWLQPGSLEFEGHYWPLVYTTLWLEHKLWGFGNPLPFHLTNLLLHGAITLLLWRLLARLAVPGAWLVAAVFALHPVHVEAVAWVIARKDLLATLFYLLAAGCWLGYRQRPQAKTYALFLGLFVAGMLSKSLVITLPASLLVWVWWQEGRLQPRDLLQMAPPLLLGFAIIAFDLHHYAARADLDLEEYGFLERLVIAGKALWFYAGKLLWPYPLLVTYPLWEVDPARLLNWLPLLAALGLALALWLARHRLGRGPLAGALFYAITLSPVLGFGDNAFMLFAFAADRYQYLAGAGLMAPLVAGAVLGCRRLAAARLAMPAGQALALALLLAYGALTFRQAQTFESEITLFSQVVKHNPDAYHVHFNLGNALMEAKRFEEAAASLKTAVARNPETANIHINQGVVWLELQDYRQAEAAFRKAIALEPGTFQAHQNLAAALRRQQRPADALAAMQAAARLLPQVPAQHYYYMAQDATALGQPQAAEQYFRQALQADPAHTESRRQLLFLYLEQQRYQAAQQLEPRLIQVLDELAFHHYNAGETDQALALYRHSLAIDPQNAHAHANLGAALAQSGRYQQAQQSFARALELDPSLEAARTNLARIRERLEAQ